MSAHRRIAVAGLGYIGLPTAVVLADNGHTVIGVDPDSSRVEQIGRGDLPFVEPGLDIALGRVVADGSLTVRTTPTEAEVHIIAVPTPHTDDHRVDTSYIDAVARNLAPHLRGDELIILESTVAPGTTDHLAELLLSERPDLSLDGEAGRPLIHVAHCPERVLPGKVMEELVTNDRLIGGLTPEAGRRATEVYASFCTGEIRSTAARTAEMAKLTENAFRDVNIAFANELSVICDRLGIDVWELIELANLHPRVNVLQPGPGVGGHCIAVDPWFIVASAPEEARLIHQARLVNDGKPLTVIDKVLAAVDGQADAVVATLGLSFKPDIDDLRESPALDITVKLADKLPNAPLLVVEPYVDSLPAPLADAPNVSLHGLGEAIERASVVVLLVDHQEFKQLDRTRLRGKTVIDTRGAWR
ncbi:UDP-N-acetyl-D-mannosamine dehydrogenase [Naumannella halotolerans]|uniref:UDP-N-acetyl-D-mannosaminuronic acid dehydrogenase n=1 Tax=Naumannella halotolerans TaxID=993414 RepID=A0A4V3EMF9_9ACTN|nr:UDP-N-acetyl-D-mannosamine dehydrogenase [Naumannella halotolerans]TDT29968.1 UDP-N-acetyl-D-mannosaminuronic acid dehydrogenase [Naumannella halotolerans]